jgi:NAD(P) transhydrogenase subunit alpha
MDSVALLTVLVLAGFTGYEVIAKVSSALHTPLMSGTNAISGIVLVGTVVVAARADSVVSLTLALVAIALAAVNLVGGFFVTDRMLQMFSRRKRRPDLTETDA